MQAGQNRRLGERRDWWRTRVGQPGFRLKDELAIRAMILALSTAFCLVIYHRLFSSFIKWLIYYPGLSVPLAVLVLVIYNLLGGRVRPLEGLSQPAVAGTLLERLLFDSTGRTDYDLDLLHDRFSLARGRPISDHL